MGNRYWSFRDRQHTGVTREIVVFAALNAIGLLIQDATVAFNSYALGLGHNKLAGFIALNSGIVLATLFRFWSYRHFVWLAPPAGGTRDAAGRPWSADRPPQAPSTPRRRKFTRTRWTTLGGLRGHAPRNPKAARRHASHAHYRSRVRIHADTEIVADFQDISTAGELSHQRL